MRAHPWTQRMAELAAAGLERAPRRLLGPPGPEVETPDGRKLLFCSNDYLGLAADPRLAAALAAAAAAHGVGAGASRLVSGNHALHEEAERRLAAFAGTDAAVLFPSGYQANVGAITALTDAGDTIFSDALNHASIIDGCRLASARVRVYRHGDPEHLARLLDAAPAGGLRLVITEALFSMDGDAAPLAEICATARARGADVYVDEAHSLGVLGPGGRGLAAALGLGADAAIRIGTFGKALGVAGAFVACPADAARLLVSRARSLLYTTAPPLPIAAAILAGLDLLAAADDRRAALAENVRRFRARAAAAGVPLAASASAIQPVPIGDARRAMAVSAALWRRGVFVQGNRPPTVPAGTARLRITLTALHTEAQIDRLATALAEALAEAGGAP